MRLPLLLLAACQASPPAAELSPPPGEDAPVGGDTGLLGDTARPEEAIPDAEEEALGTPLLRFDPEPGLMEGAFSLKIYSAVKSGRIRFTRDGTDPRSSASAEDYSTALSIDATTVLRAALLEDGESLGPVATGTWIFPAQVADQQAPEGWPETWFDDYGGLVFQAHYGLEEEVVDADPAAFEAALRALPALCLVVDPADLWGDQGLYDHAWEEGEAWERPVHVSLLNAEQPWEADAGLRMYGGASRYPTGTPKKTFRVVFRSEYGPSSLEATLFGDQADEVNSFILRAGYNHSWTHWDPGQRSRSQYLRDRFARQSQRATGWAASRGRAVQLFLDGMYWGVYDLTERADAHFFAAAYGEQDGSTDPEGWDVLNSGEAIDGDLEAWSAALALARADDGSDAALAALEEVVDSDALIDYMLMNFWVGNVDWPYHNWYAGRAREGGRWRFVSWDAEHILEDLSDDVTGVSDTGTPAEFWRAFVRHGAFVARVGDRAAVLFGEGGAFSASEASARMEALVEEVRPGLLAESARWGSYRRDVYCYASPPCTLYTVDGDWQVEHDRLASEILPARGGMLRSQLTARGWLTPE